MIRFISVLFLWFSGFVAFAAPGREEIVLEFIDSTDETLDGTSINLNYGTGADYNYTEDSKKILNGTLQIPQIFSITSDNINCLINSNGPFNSTQVIPLGFRSYNTGTYTIRIKSLLNVDPASVIRLEDKQMGVFHLLQAGDYTFQLTGQQLNTSRFVLRISYPPLISTLNADCNDEDGEILIAQDSTIVWTECELLDNANNLITTQTNVTNAFSFPGLDAGEYKLIFVYQNYSATKPVTLRGNKINVTIAVEAQSVAAGETVQFTSWATNALHYDWDFGEGTIINEIANPEVTYYQTGTFNVMLRASNDYGCEAYAYVTITVTPATGINEGTLAKQVQVYATGSNVIINNTAATLAAKYTIANINGQVVSEGEIQNSITTIPLPANAAGIYIVSIISSEAMLSRKVFIGK